jgi:hypothetical protein
MGSSRVGPHTFTAHASHLSCLPAHSVTGACTRPWALLGAASQHHSLRVTIVIETVTCDLGGNRY